MVYHQSNRPTLGRFLIATISVLGSLMYALSQLRFHSGDSSVFITNSNTLGEGKVLVDQKYTNLNKSSRRHALSRLKDEIILTP